MSFNGIDYKNYTEVTKSCNRSQKVVVYDENGYENRS